jgi:hypothetical protein
MKRAFAVGVAIAGAIGIGNSALCVPVPNQQGDYPKTSFNPPKSVDRQSTWKVFDPDPQGLRCRMAKQFQDIDVVSDDAPQALFQRNNISQWPIVRIFRRGQRIQAETGPRGQIVVLDSKGSPWFPIRIAKGDCFVRANNRFIRPVPENPTTLIPLDGNRNFSR